MDIIKILGGAKQVAFIALAIFLAWQIYTLGSEGSSFLKKQNAYLLKQQANTAKLNNILTELADKQAELTTKLAERDEKVYETRMDMGKSIKRLNTKVKAIKKIEDAKESYTALERAWDGE